MKMDKLKQRLQKDRAMVTITMRIPEDILKDLKRVAPLLGFSGYQPLMRAYVGQGLRTDLEQLENNLDIADLIESLRRHGVNDEIIETAMIEAGFVEA